MELLLQTTYSQQHDLAALQRSLENASGSKGTSSTGKTILKILAVIAGLFLVLASLAVFPPGAALLTVIVIGSGCGVTFYKADAIVIFFRTLRPRTWFSSNRRGNVSSSTGRNVGFGSGHNRRKAPYSSSTNVPPNKRRRDQQTSSQFSTGGNVPFGGGHSSTSPGTTVKTPTKPRDTSSTPDSRFSTQTKKEKNVGFGEGRGRK